MEQANHRHSRKKHLNRIKQSFSSNVRAILDQRGMTQREVCRQTGLKPFELNKYLTMTIAPKPDKVDLVARALGLHADDLVPGYVQPEGKAFNAQFTALGNDKIWIEVSGAYDRTDAKRIMGILGQAYFDEHLPAAGDTEGMNHGEA